MMTGVLVIAFPVSVFSDLWSRELKRTGALAALEEDMEDDGDDDGDRGGEEVNNRDTAKQLVAELDDHDATPVKLGTRGFPDGPNQSIQSVESLPSELPSMKGFGSSSSLKANQVAIDRDDLISLLAHVQTMQESQREVKGILRKYKSQLQQFSSLTHD